MRHKAVVIVLLVALATASSQRSAAVPPDATAQAEVQHLLQFLENSGCSFFRNGEWYPARRAAEHLRSKYDYLVTRNKISTAEDFIQKAASFSSFSSQPYKVRCGPQAERLAAQWLSAELDQFRTTRR